MQLSIDIYPSSSNDDLYFWTVNVLGYEPITTHYGVDTQDDAAVILAAAVAELVKNAEIL